MESKTRHSPTRRQCLTHLIGLALLLPVFPTEGADKSGVTPNAISLPSGPGAIEGLGESFQPTLNTGTAKYQIGLKLPPGTAGHAPHLALNYEGGSGNGPLGFGWRIALPHVQRRTDHGIPLYADQFADPTLQQVIQRPDTFLNEANEVLVPVTNHYYFCKNEDAFVRYRHVNDHWEGTRPDGTRLKFGVTYDGRVEDPLTGRVFCWLLEEEIDTHGNTILYEYEAAIGPENLNQKYLTSIRYGPGSPPWNNFHFVQFEYEPRSDWFEDARAGFLVRTGQRLKRITIGTQGPSLPGHAQGDFNDDSRPDHLVRRYALTYADDLGTELHWSLLASVQLIGADDASSLPPATFGYTICNPAAQLSAAGHVIESVNEPTLVMDHPQIDFADLNGDGLPDILRTFHGSIPHQVWLNEGPVSGAGGQSAIQWAAPQDVGGDSQAWQVNLDSTSEVAHLSDMDGDGLADLVVKSGAGDVYYFSNNRLSWGNRAWMSVQDFSPPSPYANPEVRTADIDFDKRMDIIQSLDVGGGADYRIWFNLGEQRYTTSYTASQVDGVRFSDRGVHLADFNGDRVPDLAQIRATRIEVRAGLGYGRFAPLASALISDETLDIDLITRAKLTDITGDGLVDLVIERAPTGDLWFWVNQGNYTLSARRIITGMPTVIGVNAVVRWADVNGNGSVDLVYADSDSLPRLRAIDFAELLIGDQAPNLLIRIANGIGRTTQITYQSSVAHALADAAAGEPWPDPIPFPISVVSTVTTGDSLGHEYVTRYRYHDGYYDPVEKQFRGFAEAEQLDVGDSMAPTLVTRSHFDTGRGFESMKGKLLRLTTEEEGGGSFWDEHTTWINPPLTLVTGTNAEAVHYVHPVATRRVITEQNRGTPRVLESEFAYDQYGNQIREARYGIVEDGNRSAFDDERITTYTFALNLEQWILRSPCRRVVSDENGVLISRIDDFYDDETFSATNFGQVQQADFTLRREWIDPNNPDAFVASQRTKYDAYGNPIVQLDPLAVAPSGVVDPNVGHYREVTFDPQFHTFPVRESVHLGQAKPALTFDADYDAGFGRLTVARDYNAQETTYGYDAFGRLQRILEPGDSPDFPSAEYAYALAHNVPAGIVNYTETRSLDKTPGTAAAEREHYFISRQFIDGLGRTLMTKKEAGPSPIDGRRQVIVSGATRFNARQKPSEVLNPFYSLVSGETTDALLEFEDISDSTWRGEFHDVGESVTLNLTTAHKTRTRYDATLREIETTNPDDTPRRTVFEPLVIRSFDENDTSSGSSHADTPKVVYHDGLGRHVRTDEVVRLEDDGQPAAELKTWTTRFSYDLNDQLVRIIDAQNNIKELVYDGLKRLISMNDPDRGSSTLTYDNASNRIESRDAKDQRITYTYDGANRLLTEDYHDEDQPFSAGYVFDPLHPVSPTNRPDVAYFYDTPVANLDLGNGGVGNPENTRGMLAYVWDHSGEEHFSYDSRRRESYVVKRIIDPIQGTLTSFQTRREYDAMDRLKRLIYPDNDAVDYRYNDRNRLAQITGAGSGAILSDLEYLPSDQIQHLTYGNGVSTRYEYDTRLRLRSLFTAPNTKPDEPYVAFDYSFDGASNLETIRDQRPTTVVPSGSPQRNSQQFDYDDLYRLTRVRYGFGPPGDPATEDGQIDYRYNRIGNRLSQTSNIEHSHDGLSITDLGTLDYGGESGAWDRVGRDSAEPGVHALSAIRHPESAIRSYGYDANGNLTHQDEAVYTWDFRDRLVSVETSTVQAQYRYDYRHRRITRQVTPKPDAGVDPAPDIPLAAETTFYVSPSFEVRPHQQPIKYVWNGDRRIARVTGSLSQNPRVQRLKLTVGWNLVALAVSVTNLWDQLHPASPESPPAIVEAAYRWIPNDQTFQELAIDGGAPAGTVLWLQSSSAGTVSVRGGYVDPESLDLPALPGFLLCAGFEPLALREVFVPEDAASWMFEPTTQSWLAQRPPPLAKAELPPWLAPGEVLFLKPDGPVQVAEPDFTLRIHYYHHDHLGSSSVITDAEGQLIEETAFYPFGEVRHRVQPRRVHEPYQFTQKEMDTESGLHYFETRYFSGLAGHFITPDPVYGDPASMEPDQFQSFLANPQDLNLYAYVRNNPFKYNDPTGLGLELVDDKLPKSQQPRTVISGHGAYIRPENIDMRKVATEGRMVGKKGKAPGYFTVPKGVTITFYAKHGQGIDDSLGNAIESQQVSKDQWKITFYPGARIPNYAVAPPVGLKVVQKPGVNVITVKRPTSLSKLLKPGMGPVHFAACRSAPGIKSSTVVDVRDFRAWGFGSGKGGSALYHAHGKWRAARNE